MSEPLPPGFVLDPVGSRTTGLRGPEAGWEVHADYGMRHSYNARVPFSRERIALGPVTYDDGTMRIYASPDDEPAPANRLQDIDRASRFDAHGLDSAEVGSLEAVSGFMFEEMKKNYRSDEVRKIAKLNASRIGTGKALMEWTA